MPLFTHNAKSSIFYDMTHVRTTKTYDSLRDKNNNLDFEHSDDSVWPPASSDKSLHAYGQHEQANLITQLQASNVPPPCCVLEQYTLHTPRKYW